jgi:AAA family ATP:ADP antiporter
MPHDTDDKTKLTPVERVLHLITDVRAGEGSTALLLALNVFLVLCSYYLIKPVREALLGAVTNGPLYKSYMGAGVAILLFFAVRGYARLDASWPRNKLVLRVSAFFAANLVGFYLLGQTPWVKQELGATLYGLGFELWMGVFNMMIVAQFWAFAADIYTEDQGKRLFPLVAVGASLGAMVGSGLVSRVVHALGTLPMMLISAGVLVAAALLTQFIHARAGRGKDRVPQGEPNAAREKEPANNDGDQDRRGAYTLVFQNKYLRLIAIFTTLFTLVNTSGEYMISQLVSDAAKQQGGGNNAVHELIARTMGDYFLWVNVAGLFIQLFLVSRIIKYGGFRVAFLVFPVVALASAATITAIPTLPAVRIGKTAENSIDYSLNNTVRNMLWLPTTRRVKYVAKQAVDGFFARFGDVGSAAFVFILVGQLHLGVRGVAAMNVVLVLVWIYVAWRIVDERERLPKDAQEGAAKDGGKLVGLAASRVPG